MAINLDSYLGIHAQSLTIRDQRATQIARNLANVNTPNYKAQDIDFNQALEQAMGNQGHLAVDNPLHMQATGEFSNTIKYRTPLHNTLDGNTVDKDMETTEFAKNAVSYQASLTFLNSKIRSMLTALRGE